jgi:4-hydroxy-tetrahydrodipicolinate synthase
MISGSLVALVTPMHANGDVDWESLSRLVEWHVTEGTHAIVAVGTTGESPTLDVDEHIRVISEVIKTAAGRIPVIAGTGANSTKEAIELTTAAKNVGADACLLVTPYYNKPTQEGLYRHFMTLADAVAIPQILYNVPGRTGCDIKNETVFRLVDHPNIVGIKDATGDLARGRELIAGCGDRMAVYSGDDETACDLILMGAKGDISVTANVAPKAMSQMCAAALAGRADEAQVINQRLMPLHKHLFIESNPIPVKWALHAMGRMDLGIRLPLTVLSDGAQKAVREAMESAGVL